MDAAQCQLANEGTLRNLFQEPGSQEVGNLEGRPNYSVARSDFNPCASVSIRGSLKWFLRRNENLKKCSQDLGHGWARMHTDVLSS